MSSLIKGVHCSIFAIVLARTSIMHAYTDGSGSLMEVGREWEEEKGMGKKVMGRQSGVRKAVARDFQWWVVAGCKKKKRSKVVDLQRDREKVEGDDSVYV